MGRGKEASETAVCCDRNPCLNAFEAPSTCSLSRVGARCSHSRFSPCAASAVVCAPDRVRDFLFDGLDDLSPPLRWFRGDLLDVLCDESAVRVAQRKLLLQVAKDAFHDGFQRGVLAVRHDGRREGGEERGTVAERAAGSEKRDGRLSQLWRSITQRQINNGTTRMRVASLVHSVDHTVTVNRDRARTADRKMQSVSIPSSPRCTISALIPSVFLHVLATGPGHTDGIVNRSLLVPLVAERE